jgi:carboxypeptidase C (cathepsin A)
MRLRSPAISIAFLIPVFTYTQVPRALVDHQPSISTTKQSGTFGGHDISYTAIVEEHILKGPDSIPNAFLVTIAYVRDGITDKSRRPVAFAFNGGPGASSSPLHFSGIGPRVGGRGGAVNNPHSILDATDLVFIDPVGTGFSRPYSTEIGKQFYWNEKGDAASVTEVIGRWLKKYGRESSPRYMIGESYGTVRIGAILRNCPNLKFDGVVLVSAVGGNGGADMTYLRGVPSMAVSAWYHELIPRLGRTVDQVWGEAVAFVRTDYSAALAQGAALPETEKNKIAEKLSSLVGLPAAFIEEKNIRLTANDWLMNVLKDKGLRVSNQDTRETGPLVLTAEQAANMSPASGLGGTHPFGQPGSVGQVPAIVPGSDSVIATLSSKLPTTALESYLKNDLQFKTPESYRSLNLDINPFWRSGGNIMNMQPADDVAARMRTDPNMRMFWIQGYFDLNTPAYSALYSYEQAGIPADRKTGIMSPGPHTAFATDESKAVLSAALRKWIH